MVRRIKIVAVGDGAVGKTCLLVTFSKNEFPDVYVPTVFENYVREFTVDSVQYELGLWDTAGQEDYDRLRPLSYTDANIVIICFSIDNSLSYNNVKDKWVPEVHHYCRNVPIILVGTKVDLRDDTSHAGKLIGPDNGQRLAYEVAATKYVEVSAKTRQNVNYVMEECVRAANASSSSWKFCSLL